MYLSKTILNNFQKAQLASTYSNFDKQHIGAVVFYKNKVLTVGWNTKKELPMQKKYNALRNFDVDKFPNYGHAEMCALNKLIHSYDLSNIDMNKISIYIWRDTKGKRALSRPCPACEAALKDLGIRHICYTGNDSYIYEEF